jgi:diguanylate cyclase (GGDEF)-like protein
MRRYSLKSSLLLLAALCVLPSAGINAWLLYSNIDLRRSNAEQDTLMLARQVAADLENEFSAIESALKVLAAAPELQRGDLAGFQKRARDALVAGTVYNYVLTDRRGHQVMNTLVPFGSRLPQTGTPAQLERVFTQGQTVLTDLFTGPVTKRRAIAMGVPVRVQGEVLYSLNIGLSPDRLNQLLERQSLPGDWLIAVLDRSGTIVARSREPERYVGEKAVPPLREALARQSEARLRIPTKEGIAAFAALKPSGRWGWGIAVGMHESALYAQVQTMIFRTALWTCVALGLSLLLALGLARRVLATVSDINNAAKTLSRGDAFEPPKVQFLEAEAVGEALRQASVAMDQATFLSQHDALTALPNRTMFLDFAERQLALASRGSHSAAVIAIDLDNFKTVNDTQGHAVGDALLIEAAQRIQKVVRSSDLAARFGGDEFMVLLSETEPALAFNTAERIVEALGRPYTMTDHPVTGSAGVAVFPQDGTALNALMAAADQSLYAAKAAGRSCVRGVTPPTGNIG